MRRRIGADNNGLETAQHSPTLWWDPWLSPSLAWRRQKMENPEGMAANRHHLGSLSEDHLGQSLQLSAPSFCKSTQGFHRRLRAVSSHLTLPVASRWVPSWPPRLQLLLFLPSWSLPCTPFPSSLSFCLHQSEFLRSRLQTLDFSFHLRGFRSNPGWLLLAALPVLG